VSSRVFDVAGTCSVTKLAVSSARPEELASMSAAAAPATATFARRARFARVTHPAMASRNPYRNAVVVFMVDVLSSVQSRARQAIDAPRRVRAPLTGGERAHRAFEGDPGGGS
jgi:hypothetical protein